MEYNSAFKGLTL